MFKNLKRKNILLLIFILLISIVFFIFLFNYQRSIYEQFLFQIKNLNQNTVFYDINNKPFHILQGNESRAYVTLDETSPNILQAVIAIEDKRFFSHYGIDTIRLAKAVINYLIPGAPKHGASTITQQLIKLTLLSPERTIRRKLKEIIYAIIIEFHLNKTQILELYLNKVYFGGRNYGIFTLSMNYFKKHPSEISLAEASIIAGLIKKPEGYSPLNSTRKTRKRQLIVLNAMLKNELINQVEYDEAKDEKVVISPSQSANIKFAPYFVSHVLSILSKKYSSTKIYGGGLKIYTTLDYKQQELLEESIDKKLQNKPDDYEVAGISINPKNGYVNALVGGKDFYKSEFNRATQAQRQPGSSFKPILYAAALENGFTTETLIDDFPVSYSKTFFEPTDDITDDYYTPININEQYYGEISFAYALQTSNNIVSVKILDKIGINTLAKKAKKFHVPINKKKGLCLALGCSETNLLSLTNAYTAFVNYGEMYEPQFILKVVDSFDNVLESHLEIKTPERVYDENIAVDMNELLYNVVKYGTGINANTKNIQGGKTGTTNDFRDAWFIGYTEDIVAGFWIGKDDNSPMKSEFGGTTTAQIWKDFIESIDKEK